MLKQANECITRGLGTRPVELVFDEFWRQGELAMMFGEQGSGKSFLALQIADALASGRGIGSFRLESDPGKVLYVDLAMNDEQFARRYMWEGYRGKEQPYTFSSRLYRDRPPTDDDLIPWLFEQVESERIKYVIIDDLSSVMKTCDGTRETLSVMRQLRRLRDRFGVSILVLVPSGDPGRDGIVSESDLGRQRALCRVADSVFAIGRHTKQREWRYLIQTRCRNAPLEWTSHNAVWATLGENSFRLMGLNFEDRTTEEEKRLIGEVYSAKSRGLTFREIAQEMGISKSRAARLHQRWNTTIAGWGAGGNAGVNERGDEPRNAESAAQSVRAQASVLHDDLLDSKAEDACGIRSELDDMIDAIENWMHKPDREEGRYQDSGDEDLDDEETPVVGHVEGIALANERAWAEDPLAMMETELSPTKKIRYIEERFDDGQAKIWYQYDGDTLRKYVHDGWGVSIEAACFNIAETRSS